MHDTGVLTQETLSALRLSAQSFLELAKYCINELHFKYILLGKVQTDSLESRFGQYRQMAGGQYHISVRQLCETEGRIRLQNVLPNMSSDDLRGIEEINSVRDAATSFNVHVSEADLDELRAQMPVIGYVGGYCAHAAMKVLKCESCRGHLVVTGNETETEEDIHSLITQLDRGGLKFPSALVITIVMHTEVVVTKLMAQSTSTQFLHGPNQRNVVRQLTLDSLPKLEDIDACENGHTYELLVTLVANCAANIMLNNLSKQRNDLLRIGKGQNSKNRKAQIFQAKLSDDPFGRFAPVCRTGRANAQAHAFLEKTPALAVTFEQELLSRAIAQACIVGGSTSALSGASISDLQIAVPPGSCAADREICLMGRRVAGTPILGARTCGGTIFWESCAGVLCGMTRCRRSNEARHGCPPEDGVKKGTASSSTKQTCAPEFLISYQQETICSAAAGVATPVVFSYLKLKCRAIKFSIFVATVLHHFSGDEDGIEATRV
ncbi:hypothetical protein HPB49_005279 [Dermacentor silvarum]|uniref:Uncharacterized protein n=1 Tax=Dermacentor silvarum TaxID=543639 RepID=A0ACB8C2A6_DERSI|nr:hypothetical protein HPB49_005279 [Dermacentor silvarum]